MIVQPVKVPRELVEVPAVVLEEYVRCRMLQFIKGFGQRIAQLQPLLEAGVLDRAVRDTLEVLPLPDYGQVPVEMLELQLVFRHDCIALGCTEPQCVLCQHNSQRRCTMNFNKKYLVNDRMLARCGAQIRIEVVDRATGKMFDGELPDVYLEVSGGAAAAGSSSGAGRTEKREAGQGYGYDSRDMDMTAGYGYDGRDGYDAYDQKFLGDGNGSSTGSSAGANCDAGLDECALLMNNKSQPLLGSTNTGKADTGGRLLLQTTNGRLMLPDLFVTDSSEALLSGRKPPFKLVVRAKHRDGRQLAIRHAVSEPFVVATRRVRASHKVEIPSMDDPVSKLDHMGKETVKKLLDLRSAAAQIGVDLSALEPELNRIEKVREFRALALRVEGDGHLRQQLQTLLKLAKDKWEEAAEHAKRAVVPDNRMRAWYADRSTLELGLLFPCRLGVVNLKRPEGHAGWTIFPADTDTFEVGGGGGMEQQPGTFKNSLMLTLQLSRVLPAMHSGLTAPTSFPSSSSELELLMQQQHPYMAGNASAVLLNQPALELTVSVGSPQLPVQQQQQQHPGGQSRVQAAAPLPVLPTAEELQAMLEEHDVIGSDGLTVIGAAGADLPEVDASAPHPFYEQLKRDSLKSRSRCGSKKRPVLGEGLSAMQVSLKDCPSLLALGAGGPLDFTFSKTGLGSKGMSMELPSMLLQVLSGSAEGVQGLGPGIGGPGGPSAAKKPLQLADSGLANMLSMGQALEEVVSMEEQQIQQASGCLKP
eukprot:gene2954-3239_t